MLDILFFFSLRAQVQPKPPSGSVGWLSALMNCSSGSLYCPLKLANYEMITGPCRHADTEGTIKSVSLKRVLLNGSSRHYCNGWLIRRTNKPLLRSSFFYSCSHLNPNSVFFFLFDCFQVISFYLDNTLTHEIQDLN